MFPFTWEDHRRFTMFRKVLGSLSLAIFAVGIFTASAIAQTAPIAGIVELKTAENKVVPVEGAVIEVYRTDTKSGGPSDRTDKKGNFSFAGVLVAGTYVLSISAPGAQPSYYPNVRPGQASDNIKILLEPGDGRKLTADEVRQLVAASSGGGTITGGKMSEEDKKKQAEYEAEVKKVNDKNDRIKAETAIIQASLKDGNAAYEAKNWDLAVSKYDEGINANPNYAGSAPVLLNNKGAALRQRAINHYNDNVRNTDATAKIAAFNKVKADLGTAAESHFKAIEVMKNAPAGDITDPNQKTRETTTALRGAAESFRLMARTEQVDDTKLEIAKSLIPDYIAQETDAAQKDQAKLILADLYRVAGDADNAIAEYRKALEASPENLDVLAGLGLSLVNAGYINNNKEQLQEGANFLQKFASAAPATHKYKDDAVGLIESLKTEQKITPQKVAPARRRGN